LQVDPDGSGDAYSDLAILQGSAGTTLGEVLDNLVLIEGATS
jgi:hypothetical protein